MKTIAAKYFFGLIPRIETTKSQTYLESSQTLTLMSSKKKTRNPKEKMNLVQTHSKQPNKQIKKNIKKIDQFSPDNHKIFSYG